MGDKIILMRHDKGSWSDPVEVTAEFGDRYRPALAVDESGRVWVFWSENAGGNFDLYARSYQNGTLGEVVRITRDPGSDVFAVAATDSSGRVWVAWQAFRNGRAEIHASHLTGSRFSGPVIVAASAANEWNPAIAASPGGDVTVAWDSYRSGDYDVFVRTFDKHARLGNERAVAESERYEAHPSLAYDPQGRMWIAWEESDKGWGKDFGAYETSGIGLYQGRWIELRVLEGNRLFTAGDLGSVLPGSAERTGGFDGKTGRCLGGNPARPDPGREACSSSIPGQPTAAAQQLSTATGRSRWPRLAGLPNRASPMEDEPGKSLVRECRFLRRSALVQPDICPAQRQPPGQ